MAKIWEAMNESCVTNAKFPFKKAKLRGYCPNRYTVVTMLFILMMNYFQIKPWNHLSFILITKIKVTGIRHRMIFISLKNQVILSPVFIIEFRPK